MSVAPEIWELRGEHGGRFLRGGASAGGVRDFVRRLFRALVGAPARVRPSTYVWSVLIVLAVPALAVTTYLALARAPDVARPALTSDEAKEEPLPPSAARPALPRGRPPRETTVPVGKGAPHVPRRPLPDAEAARRQSAGAVFWRLKQRADALAKAKDFDGALAVYDSVPVEYRDLLSEAAASGKRGLRRRAYDTLRGPIAYAEAVLAEPRASRSALERAMKQLEGAKYAPARTEVDRLLHALNRQLVLILVGNGPAPPRDARTLDQLKARNDKLYQAFLAKCDAMNKEAQVALRTKYFDRFEELKRDMSALTERVHSTTGLRPDVEKRVAKVRAQQRALVVAIRQALQDVRKADGRRRAALERLRSRFASDLGDGKRLSEDEMRREYTRALDVE